MPTAASVFAILSTIHMSNVMSRKNLIVPILMSGS